MQNLVAVFSMLIGLARVDLLCIDELGYMELNRRGAELLFQVLTERTFGGYIIETGTDSYRLATTRARADSSSWAEAARAVEVLAVVSDGR